MEKQTKKSIQQSASDLPSDDSPTAADGNGNWLDKTTIGAILTMISIMIGLAILKYHEIFHYEDKKVYVWSAAVFLSSLVVGFVIVSAKKKGHRLRFVISLHIVFGSALGTWASVLLLLVPSPLGWPVIIILAVILMFSICKLFHQMFSSIFRKLCPKAPAANDSVEVEVEAGNVQPTDELKNPVTEVDDLGCPSHSSGRSEADDADEA